MPQPHHNKKKPVGQFTFRTRFIAICFSLLAVVCLGRLYQLQVLRADDYAARADREFAAPTDTLFDRGDIYFTTKDGVPVAAATTRKGTKLAIEPPKVTDPAKLYDAVNALVSFDKDTFMAKVTKPGIRYVDMADHLSTTTGAALQAIGTTQKLPGIDVLQSTWRYYPAQTLAAQTVGFIGYDGDQMNGRNGLERFYEKNLLRTDTSPYENFFVQLFSGAERIAAGENEGDIITTIEPTVQAELDRTLAAYDAQWHPKAVAGIIMDPNTGAIYAISQFPTFDLNNFSGEKDSGVFTNALAQRSYEMGSIIKPLTMAAGIDTGAITATTTYDDTGCITVNTAHVCNFDHKARGVIPMQQILSQSLNVGVSFIATRLGPDRFRDYFLNHYHFGDKTGVDLPSEASGQVANLQNPRQLYYDEASFGQAIALTPLQTVRGLAILANGGRLVTPHLANAIRSTMGTVKPIDWRDGEQVLATSTVITVDNMLIHVVDNDLIKGQYKNDHYTVGAKTGTAQIAAPGGGYLADTYLHSFFGFFPATPGNARFIIFLYALQPQGAEYASQTWAAYFHDLTLFLINYYNVPPDR